MVYGKELDGHKKGMHIAIFLEGMRVFIIQSRMTQNGLVCKNGCYRWSQREEAVWAA